MKLNRFLPRLRFSLRAMLVVLTLVGCALGWLMLKRSEARQEREAAESLSNLNAMVLYDYGPFEMLSQPTPPGPRWLTALLGENLFVHVQQVSFPYVDGVLPEQPYRVDRRDLSDRDLALVGRFKHLKGLNLSGFPIRSAALADIEHLSSLIDLSLGVTAIDNEALKHVGKLINLQKLNLWNTNITSDGLKHLAELGQLRMLHVGGTRVSDEGLVHLANLHGLRTLYLANDSNAHHRARITDRGMRHLRKLPNLEHLSLIGTDVTDTGLKELASLKHLQNLDVSDTKVSEPAARKLEAAVPGLKVATERPTR